MNVGLDYSIRNFYLLEVNSIRMSESDNSTDYFSKMLSTGAVLALEHFYLSTRISALEIKSSEIFCFTEEELKDINYCLDSSMDVLWYEITNLTNVFLYGTKNYTQLFDMINVGNTDSNFVIMNNFLKQNTHVDSVKLKVKNVGFYYLFPVEKEILLNTDYKPNIVRINSYELLSGFFKPRIFFYSCQFNNKADWKSLGSLIYKSITDTSYCLGFEYESKYEDICEETEYGEVGVCVALPTHINILEAVFSFFNVGNFAYEIKDITDNIILHENVPDIYLKKFNSNIEFYNSIDSVVRSLTNIDFILQKMNNNGKLYFLPCENELLNL